MKNKRVRRKATNKTELNVFHLGPDNTDSKTDSVVSKIRELLLMAVSDLEV